MTDDLTRLSAADLADRLASREVSSVDAVRAHLDRIDHVDGDVHAFLHVSGERALGRAAEIDAQRADGAPLGPLAGVPIAIKDVLCTIDMPSTAGSRMLEGWTPPYDATVVQRLRAAGLVPLGKTNMDEFAMGSSTEHSAFGATHNPWDLDRIPGGSGGGSAAAVAAFEAPVALGSDTGGSIRQPAAVTGSVGVKPTYGGVSRYGAIALASSLDQVGPVSRTVLDSALVHDVIGGHDPRDSTSLTDAWPSFAEAARAGQREGSVKGLRIGVVKQLDGEGFQAGVTQRFREALDLLEQVGAEIVEVSAPNFEHAIAAYYLILPAEASSNLAKFDSVRFGLRVNPPGGGTVEDVMAATREAGFGPEVKRRIILGTYALSAGYYDAYYGSAQKVRTLIQRDFDAAFQQVDVLVTPSAPTTAFKLGEKLDDPLAMYLNDLTTIPANLAGVPGIGLPIGLAPEDGLPVGSQFMAPAREDARLYTVGAALEGILERQWGDPCSPRHPSSRAPHHAPRTETRTDGQGRADGLRRGHRDVRARARVRGPRGAEHAHEDVLRRAELLRRRAQHQHHTVDLGLPGSLPVVNEQAVKHSISLGLALGCEIAPSSRFARKNYFYPALAKNYQISQFDEPSAFRGSVEVEMPDGRIVTVPIERAHMEEDAGKLTHVGGATGRIQGADHSLVDYNRAGVPLVEIVTDIIYGAEGEAPELAKAYVSTIRDIVVALGISDAKMERGNLRCDANISLSPRGSGKLGTRTETKNVNSLRSVERAIRYEIQRQAAILAAGGTITQETRHWHEDTGRTSAGRPKSDADDYRYFPEPDLLPVQPSAELIEELRAALPEAPAIRRRRLKGEWGFTDLEYQHVVNSGLLTELVDTVEAGAAPQAARKWWTGEIARIANARGVDAATLISPTQVASVIELVEAGTLTNRLARDVIEGVIDGEGTAQEVVDARGLAVVSDDGPLIEAIDAALQAQPDGLAKIRDGKAQAAGAVIGAVMKAMRGQADAGRVRELVLERAQAS